jgi:hypothetical protein
MAAENGAGLHGFTPLFAILRSEEHKVPDLPFLTGSDQKAENEEKASNLALLNMIP